MWTVKSTEKITDFQIDVKVDLSKRLIHVSSPNVFDMALGTERARNLADELNACIRALERTEI